MNHIKTTDNILIRDRNKLYLQVNYNFDEAIKVISAKISIDGTYYDSSYIALKYAIFDLSFLKNNKTYNCYVEIEYASYIESTSGVITYNILTEDECNIITENTPNYLISEDASKLVSIEQDYAIYMFTSNSFTITTNFIVKKPSIIKIYEYDETDFYHNGLGILTPTSAVITRTLNDMGYYLDLVHPFDEYGRWKRLQEDRIIKANNQLFRIKHITKTLSDITVYAEHIFFDLQNNFIEDTNIVQRNGRLAINQILTHTSYAHPFTGTSNVATISSSRIVRKNVISALIGSDENSFINRWGGELDMDWLSFSINNRIGQDRGYKIAYGKNLTGLNAEFDMSNVCTVIRPIGFDGIELPDDDKYVYSQYVNNYAMPIIREYKYEDVKWVGSPNYKAPSNEEEDDGAYKTLKDAQKELKRRAEMEFTENKIDIPSVTYNIKFIELSQTEEYKEYQALAKINIGDNVTITHKQLGIDIPARCISYKYNCLTSNFDEITLGYYNQNFFSQTVDTINESGKFIQTLPSKLNDILQQAKDHASDLIKNGFGGHVFVTPNAIYIMDTDDINTAQKIWVWNVNGLGYSSTGINGEFGLAMTMDGSIVADFITTGVMSADRVRTGNIISADGTVNIDLNNNYIKIQSEENENATVIDSSGMEVQSGQQTLATFREKSYIPYLYADDITCANLVRKHPYSYDYYVNGKHGAGSDLNSGLTTTNQLSTIQRAIDILPDLLEHDVTIHVYNSCTGFNCVNKVGNGLITICLHKNAIIKGNVVISGCNGIRIIYDSEDTTNGYRTSTIFGYVSIYETRQVEIDGIIIDGQGIDDAVYLERNTKVFVSHCGFRNASNSYIKTTYSELYLMDNIGDDVPYFIDSYPWTELYFTSYHVPNYTSSLWRDHSGNTTFVNDSHFSETKTSLNQTAQTYTASGKTQQWNCYNYVGHETLLWNYDNAGVIRQGYVASWSTGRWWSEIGFDYNGIKNIISGATNYSGRLYVKRSSSSHGQSTGSKIALYAQDGTAIDTTTAFSRGEAKWINIDGRIIQKIANGTCNYFYVKWDANDSSRYIIFDPVFKLEITYTK